MTQGDIQMSKRYFVAGVLFAILLAYLHIATRPTPPLRLVKVEPRWDDKRREGTA